MKVLHYFQLSDMPNIEAVGLSVMVMAIMVFLPQQISSRFPGSLLGLIAATVAAIAFALDVPTIGTIPNDPAG